MIHIHNNAEDPGEAMVLYRNLLVEGTLTPTGNPPDAPAVNALGPQTYDWWSWNTRFSALQAGFAPAAGEQAADTAAVVGHNLGSLQIRVEYQIGIGGGNFQTVMSIEPEDDSDILMLFPRQTVLNHRLRFIRPEDFDPAVQPYISIAMIGERLTIPFGVAAGYTPLNLAREVDLAPSISVRGQYLGTFTKRRGAATSIPLALQRREWIENEAKPFIAHYNEGQPFVWASDPELLPNDLGYCWRSGGVLSASYGAGARFGEMSMEVSAYAP